jgi:hypothetical protein
MKKMKEKSKLRLKLVLPPTYGKKRVLSLVYYPCMFLLSCVGLTLNSPP